MDQKKFCTNCGTPISADALFCTNCGFKFASAPQPAYNGDATVNMSNPAAPQNPSTGYVPNLTPMQNVPVGNNQPQGFVPNLTPMAAPVVEPAPEPIPVATPVVEPAPEPIPVATPVVEPAPEPQIQVPAAAINSDIPADPEATVSIGLDEPTAAVPQHPLDYDTAASMETSAPNISAEPVVQQQKHQQSKQPANDQKNKQNSQQPQPEAPKRKKSSAGNVIATILSILVALGLIAPALTTVFVGAVQTQLTEQAVHRVVDELDMYEFIEGNVVINYSLGQTGYSGFTAYMYKTVYHIEDDNVDVKSQDYLNFKKKLSVIFNNSDAVNEFVETTVNSIITDVKQDTAKTELEAEDVVQLVEQLRPDIEKEFGIKMDERDFDRIKDILNNSDLDTISIKTVKKGNESVFAVIKLLLSDYTFYILIAICVVLLAAVVLINLKRFQKGLIIGGVSLAITGGIAYFISANFYAILGKLVVPTSVLKHETIRIILDNPRSFTSDAQRFIGMAGIIILGAAALFIVAGIVIAIIRGAKKKRA